MGVQKSRKSIRYTKFSLKLINQLKNINISNTLKKYKFKKLNTFNLKNPESDNYLFFDK